MSIPEHVVVQTLVRNQRLSKAKEFDATPVYIFAKAWKNACAKGSEDEKDRSFVNILIDYLVKARDFCKQQLLQMSFLDVIFTEELTAPNKTASDFKACLQTINDRIAAATPEHHTELTVAKIDAGWKDEFPSSGLSDYDELFLAEVMDKFSTMPTTAMNILLDFNATSDIKTLARILDRFYLECRTRGIRLCGADLTLLAHVRVFAFTSNGMAKKLLGVYWRQVDATVRQHVMDVSNAATEKKKRQSKDSEKEMVTSLVMDSNRTQAELNTFFEKLRETIEAQAKSKATLAITPAPAKPAVVTPIGTAGIEAAPVPAPAPVTKPIVLELGPPVLVPAFTGAVSKSEMEEPSSHNKSLPFWFSGSMNEHTMVSIPKVKEPVKPKGGPIVEDIDEEEPKPQPKRKTASDQIAADGIEVGECTTLLEYVTEVLEAERGTCDKLFPWRQHPDSDKWIDDYVDTVDAKLMARFGNDRETVALYAGELGCLPCACLDELFGNEPSEVLSANIREFAKDIVHNYYQNRIFQTRLQTAKKLKAARLMMKNKTGVKDAAAEFRTVYAHGEPVSISFNQVLVPFATTAAAVEYNIYNEVGVYVQTSEFARLQCVTSAGRAAGFQENDLVPVDIKNILVNGYYGCVSRTIKVYRPLLLPQSDSWAFWRTNKKFDDVDPARVEAQVALKQAIEYEQQCRGKFYFSVHEIPAGSEKWTDLRNQKVECTIAWSDGQQSTIYGVRVHTDLGKSSNNVQNGDIITNGTGDLFSLDGEEEMLRVFRPSFSLLNADDDTSCMWISACLHSLHYLPASQATKLLKNVTTDTDLVLQEDFNLFARKGDTIVRIGSKLANQHILEDAKRMIGIFDNLTISLIVKCRLPAVEDRLPEVGIAITVPVLPQSGFTTDATGIVTHVHELARNSGIRVGDRVSRLFFTDADERKYTVTYGVGCDRKVVLVHGPRVTSFFTNNAAATVEAPPVAAVEEVDHASFQQGEFDRLVTEAKAEPANAAPVSRAFIYPKNYEALIDVVVAKYADAPAKALDVLLRQYTCVPVRTMTEILKCFYNACQVAKVQLSDDDANFIQFMTEENAQLQDKDMLCSESEVFSQRWMKCSVSTLEIGSAVEIVRLQWIDKHIATVAAEIDELYGAKTEPAAATEEPAATSSGTEIKAEAPAAAAAEEPIATSSETETKAEARGWWPFT